MTTPTTALDRVRRFVEGARGRVVSDELAVRGVRYRDGLVWRWAIERPADEPDEIADRKGCADCGGPVSPGSVRCIDCRHIEQHLAGVDELMDRLARNFAATPALRTAMCCDLCGCLTVPSEDCPGCRSWAVTNERRWARRHIYRDERGEAA